MNYKRPTQSPLPPLNLTDLWKRWLILHDGGICRLDHIPAAVLTDYVKSLATSRYDVSRFLLYPAWEEEERFYVVCELLRAGKITLYLSLAEAQRAKEDAA